MQGASVLREAGQGGARQAAYRPQRLEARAVDCRRDVRRAGAQAAHRVPDHASRRRLRLTLELDQQQCFEPLGQAGGSARSPHEVEQRPVQQLDRRRVQGHEVGDRLRDLLQPFEPQGGARQIGGDRLQPPLDRGDERERALRPGEQVELVSGCGKAIERIAGGILARLGKVSRDQPALVGGQMEPLPGTGRDSFRAPRPPNDPPRLAIRSDDFDRFHPAPHAATPHRARPCCVGGHHAARRRERARGWVGGEPQAEGSRGRRQLGPRDGGARPEPPAGPVGRGPVEALAQVHDDAAPHASPGHPAPGAPGHERGARRSRPSDERLQLLHPPRQSDRRRNDPIDPCAFRVRGSAAGIGEEGKGCLRQDRHGSQVTTHHVPRTIRA